MTLSELRNHLLRHIGVLGIGRNASAEDAELAETVLTNCQAELDQLGIALWTIDDVPTYAIEGLMKYCAPAIAGNFGKAEEYPITDKVIGVRMLRELTADRRTSTGTADYF